MLRITFKKKVGTAVTGLGTVIKISSNVSAVSLADLLHIREDCAASAAEADISEANALASASSASSSATNAANSAAAASSSATNAANSAASALASKTAAATSETNAASSATTALASKNAAALSETNANAYMVASKASEDAAKLSELAAYASELSSAASAQDAEASKTAAATAEVNSIANATASYNYSELARGYANDAEVSKGESQASAGEAEVHAQEAIVNADAAKVSELAAKASEVASKASEVASKTSETNSKASELAAKDSETIATTKAAQTTADATLTASHVNQTASNVVLAVAAKDAAEAAASVATGGIIDKGAWDASTGEFPTKPTRPLPEGGTALVSAFWKVTVSGTAGGISFLVGDDLRFSASTDTFYKVDNTDAVASVQGKTGAVTLTASEVGALATPTGTHAVDTVLVAGATNGTSKHSGFTLAKSVPANAMFTDTVYTHPTNDGNLHVPATGTTNNGKVLAAGATAGSIAWKTLVPADVSGLDAALLAKLDATANAVSATKLQNAVTINGVAFDGSANITITAANPTTLTRGTGLTGANYNGASATTWAVAYGTAAGTACQGNDARLSDARTPLAHAHTIADTTGLQGVLDSKYSAANKPTPTDIGAANQVHSHNGIVYEDTRNTTYTPADNRNQFKVTFQALYTNEVGAGGGWYSLMHIPRYSDPSGGSGSQMAFLDNGEIYVRKGLTDTTWTGWNKIYHQGSKPTAIEIGAAPYTHSHAISEVTNLQASLNSKQSIDTTMGAIVGARYLTAGQGVQGTKIRLPFTTNSSKMVCFTVRVYQSYGAYDIQFSGYLYETTNQWHLPRAVMIAGNGAINVRMGRDTDGVAYVWIAGGHYRGVAVLDIVGGYMQGDWNTGWSITESDDTPNLAFNSYIQPPYSPHNPPTPADIGAQPAGSYAAASHTHPWAQITGVPVQATRWPSAAEAGALDRFPAAQTFGDGSVITTDQFLTILEQKGAFDKGYWAGRGTWYYAGNSYVDTGIGVIHLAGAVIEVWGGWREECTIKVTLATTGGGSSNTTHREYTYINNGSTYNPGWRADFNTSTGVPWDSVRDKPATATRWPTIAEIGAQPAGSYADASHTHAYLPLTGGTLTGNLTAPTFVGALSGNAATATLASTVVVNGSADNNFYDMLWRSGNTVFVASAGKAQLNPATGDMRLGGHVSFAYTSDENLKTGITEIENPLDKVCSLRTSTYLKKSILADEDGKYTYTPETGFIAQDLEKVIPNLISVNEHGYKTINGGGFEIEALLAGAIKELKQQHDAEIAELKAQIAALTKLV